MFNGPTRPPWRNKERSKEYLAYFKEKFNDSGQAFLPVIRQIPLTICVTNSEGIFEQVNNAYSAFNIPQMN
ncbi:hypothetical protein [Catalinimonas niigatensis]|uniref:hypothetical protein n=1 Tax=Catalinimonas niigatensis TaxID=1397264 RepID=UPI002665530B|nr:hypothetical protein [Catalinimonas niigatensis]WPP48288.1 hypothetical protein PZB72_16575 [Catalinimonas niigatensis]